MNFFNIIFGAMTALTLIFTIFPSTLDAVKKMDAYRLIVFCILGICVLYWIYAVLHSNFVKRLLNIKKPIVINDPSDGYQYLVQNNTCYHIPDPETFKYLGQIFGFKWADSKPMPLDEIKKKFIIGKDLSSIKLHFPQIDKEDGKKRINS
jgi:uncharacterized protein with PQ loop repeat